MLQQRLLQFDPGAPRYLHIEQQATRNVFAIMFEKFIGRAKALDPDVQRLKQTANRLANGRIVVHDIDGRTIRYRNGHGN